MNRPKLIFTLLKVFTNKKILVLSTILITNISVADNDNQQTLSKIQKYKYYNDFNQSNSTLTFKEYLNLIQKREINKNKLIFNLPNNIKNQVAPLTNAFEEFSAKNNQLDIDDFIKNKSINTPDYKILSKNSSIQNKLLHETFLKSHSDKRKFETVMINSSIEKSNIKENYNLKHQYNTHALIVFDDESVIQNLIFSIYLNEINKSNSGNFTNNDYVLNSNHCLNENFSDINSVVTMCKIEEFIIPQPEILLIKKIFCGKLTPKSNEDKLFCEDDSGDSINNLTSLFPELKISKFVQKINLSGELIPIRGTFSFAIEPKNTESGKKILFKNIMPENEIKIHLSDNLKECRKNLTITPLIKNSTHRGSMISKCFLHRYENNISQLTTELKLNLISGLSKDYHFENCKYENFSFLNLHNEVDENDSFTNNLFPVYDFICKTGDRSYKLIIDAENGTILKNHEEIIKSNQPLIFKNSFEAFKINKGNEMTIVVDRLVDNYKQTDVFKDLISLFNYVISPKENKIPTKEINVSVITTSCSTLYKGCSVNLACALNSTNPFKVCLSQNNNNNTAYNDETIIAHELAHILIPENLSFLNKYNQFQKRTIFSHLLHDLADAVSIFSNLNKGSLNYKIGYKACKNIENDDKCSGLRLPRIINDKDDFSKYIANVNLFNAYSRSEITARMYQIPLELDIKKKRNNGGIIKPLIKHWIRFVRSIAMYNYSSIPCNNCDLDFFLTQQNLMRNYLIQFINTSEEEKTHELLYQWSTRGYINKNHSCVDENMRISSHCTNIKNINNTQHHTADERGLANATIISTDTKKTKFSIQTGINFYFNKQNKLVKSKYNYCNTIIKITLRNRKDSESLEFNLSNGLKIIRQLNDSCISTMSISGKRYREYVKNYKNDNIEYEINTFNIDNTDSGIKNKWYIHQSLPLLKKY